MKRIITWLKCKLDRHEYVTHNTDKKFVGWGYSWDTVGICKHCGDSYRTNQFLKTKNFYDVYPHNPKKKSEQKTTNEEDRVGGVYGLLHSFYYR